VIQPHSGYFYNPAEGVVFFCLPRDWEIESGPRWWQAAGNGAVRRILAVGAMLGAHRAS